MREVKSLTTAQVVEMTRTEAFEMAWKLEAKEKDFSLVDEIYHPDYKAVGSITGIEVNLAADKEVYLALIEHLILVPAKIIDEKRFFYVLKDIPSTERQIFLCQEQLLSRTKMEKLLLKKVLGKN